MNSQNNHKSIPFFIPFAATIFVLALVFHYLFPLIGSAPQKFTDIIIENVARNGSNKSGELRLFWMLLAFGVVVFVLVKFGFPVIIKGVEDRNKYIDESLLAAKQAREELASVKANSENLIDEARKEQSRILAEAAKTRDIIVNGAKDKAAEEASKIMESAREQIALEKEDAIRQIRREVAVLSVDISEKVLRKNLDKKNEQMSMIDRLLNEINMG